MFKYQVSALCPTSVEDALNPYLDQLSPSQLRKRIRESFALLLKDKLPLIPYIESAVEHSEQGNITITTARNVSEILKKLDLCVIEFGEPRKFPIGTQRLFFIRATYSNHRSDSTMAELQAEIKQIIKEDFEGEEGPYPYTFFIVADPQFLWLPDPLDRKNAWVSQLKKIEAIITNKGIRAEFGIYRSPKRLS